LPYSWSIQKTRKAKTTQYNGCWLFYVGMLTKIIMAMVALPVKLVTHNSLTPQSILNKLCQPLTGSVAPI